MKGFILKRRVYDQAVTKEDQTDAVPFRLFIYLSDVSYKVGFFLNEEKKKSDMIKQKVW